MNFEKLNSLSESYRKSRSEDVFNELYDSLTDVRSQHIRALLKTGYGDEHDALALFDDVLMHLLDKDNVGDFGKLLTKSLKNKRNSFIRSEKRRLAHFTEETKIVRKKSDNKEVVIDLLRTDDDATYYEVIRKKKIDDQRQLIAYLLRFEEHDATTTAIVEAHFRALPNARPAAIAKSLGIHPETAKRKLKRLSRHYDATRFGDLRDYLAV